MQYTNKIDFHTHYLPESYLIALRKNISGNPDGWPTPNWSPKITLDFMDANGINYSVLSLSSPHINFGDKNETLNLANDINRVGANLAKEYPDKLGYLATLPLPYITESVAIFNDAIANNALGVTVPTNSRGIYFGSPIMDELYKVMNDKSVIVALHPNEPSASPKNVDIDLPTPLLGFFMDTTMTFVNLLKYRFFERFPNIKLIVPHAGAFLGILDDRIADYVKVKYNTDIYKVMKHVYFDTAGRVLPRQLPMLLTLADENNILYGSDIPYTPLAGSATLGQALESTDVLTSSQKNKIFHDNAYRLLSNN